MSHAGRFVWRELITPNPEAAAAFYGQVFGWSARVMPMGDGHYTMLSHGEVGVGGVMKPMMDGVPPHWLDYITVDDVDASLARVPALGGKALTGAMDIPNVGRFAVVADPGGAVFALFRGANPGETDTESRPADYTFCWSQLLASDPAKSAAFYTEIFGWQTAPLGADGVMFLRNGRPVAGSQLRPAGAGGADHWLPYVAVPDADRYHAKAVEAGARSYHSPLTIPNMGRFAVLGDPTGATVALWRDLSAAE